MIRDRDRIYGTVVTRRLRAMGIRDKPIAPASPWQNGFAERLIGSIRRECLDHVIVLGEAHLRRILKSYADYYNGVRTHRSLHKDAPVSRPVQRTGVISSRADPGRTSSPLRPGLSFRYTQAALQLYFCFAPDIVAKVFLGWQTKILEPLMRSTRGDVRGPYRFIQNRSRTSVVALESVAAAEKSKDQLARDF